MITLRTPTPADLDTIQSLITEDDIRLLLPDPGEGNIIENDRAHRESLMPYTAIIEHHGHFAGTINYFDRNVGIWVAEGFRNRGIATRGLNTFFRLWAARGLWEAGCWVENHACQTVLERAGFVLTSEEQIEGRWSYWYTRFVNGER